MEPDRRHDGPPGSRPPPGLLRFALIGMEFALGLLACTLLGYWADRHYGGGRPGTWTMVGAAIGLIGGFYNFIRSALALQKEMNRDRAAGRTRQNRDDRADTTED